MGGQERTGVFGTCSEGLPDCGQVWPTTCFIVAHELRMVSAFLSGKGKIKFRDT